MALAWLKEKGPDILLAESSAAISLLMMCGRLRVEGRFARMNVWHRGGGFPIGYP